MILRAMGTPTWGPETDRCKNGRVKSNTGLVDNEYEGPVDDIGDGQRHNELGAADQKPPSFGSMGDGVSAIHTPCWGGAGGTDDGWKLPRQSGVYKSIRTFQSADVRSMRKT